MEGNLLRPIAPVATIRGKLPDGRGNKKPWFGFLGLTI